MLKKLRFTFSKLIFLKYNLNSKKSIYENYVVDPKKETGFLGWTNGFIL